MYTISRQCHCSLGCTSVSVEYAFLIRCSASRENRSDIQVRRYRSMQPSVDSTYGAYDCDILGRSCPRCRLLHGTCITLTLTLTVKAYFEPQPQPQPRPSRNHNSSNRSDLEGFGVTEADVEDLIVCLTEARRAGVTEL